MLTEIPEEKTAFAVELLGPPAITLRSGRVTTFRSNRILALIGYLAVHEGPRSREEVAEALWPEKFTDTGRHNLRQVLVYVRQSLGSDAIESNSSYLSLNPSLEVDARTVLKNENAAQTVEDRLAWARLTVQAYKGAFLADFSDTWLARPRAQISQAYVSALLLLAESASDKNPSLELDLLNKACEESPLSDSIRARKIRAIKKSGRHADAQFEFHKYREFLLSELGIAPSPLVEDALKDQAVDTVLDDSTLLVADDVTAILTQLGTGQRPQQAVQLACALTPYWVSQGKGLQGQILLETAIRRAGARTDRHSQDLSQLALADLAVAQGNLKDANQIIDKLLRDCSTPLILTRAYILSARMSSATLKAERAESALAKAQELAVLHGLTQEQLEAYRLGTRTALLRNDLDRAIVLSREAVEAMDSLGDPLFLAEALLSLAFALESNGLTEEAQLQLERAFQSVGEISAPMATSVRVHATRLLEDVRSISMTEDDLRARIEAGYRRGVLESKSYGNVFTIAVNLTYLGDFLSANGKAKEAIGIHREALELREPQQERLGMATSLRGLGKAHLQLNEFFSAREFLAESARLYQAEEATPGYASALLDLARVELATGNHALAWRLADRSLTLLRGLSLAELKSIGPDSSKLVPQAEELTALISNK